MYRRHRDEGSVRPEWMKGVLGHTLEEVVAFDTAQAKLFGQASATQTQQTSSHRHKSHHG